MSVAWICVLIVWLGSAAAVAYKLINAGHWITAAIIFFLAMAAVKLEGK